MTRTDFFLSEISEIFDCEHKTAPIDYDGSFYSIRTTDISNGRINYEIANRVSFQTYQEWTKRAKPQKNDILFAREAPVGEVGFVRTNDDLCLGQRTVLIKPNTTNVIPAFLLYYLVNSETKNDLISRSTGSVVQHLNVKDIRNFKILLPPLPEQRTIAYVLSSLDDKIDLLHRQNKTLESMAETLFRQWFVEEADDGWKEDTFERWIIETVGGEWGKDNIDNDYRKTVNCIRGTDIADLNNGLPKRTPIRFIKEKKFQSITPEEGSLILEISGGTETQSTGRVCYINKQVEKLFNYPLVFSNFCRMIKVRKIEYSFFLYCYIQFLYNQDEFYNLENGSSGIKNLNYKALLFELKYMMPDEDAVKLFHYQVEPYFNKVDQNKLHIRTLESLRDTLLPKLMSGEVRVQL